MRTALLTGCTALLLIAGCVTEPPRGDATDHSTNVSPDTASPPPGARATGRALLREFASTERVSPDATAQQMPPPIGLASELVEPLTAEAQSLAEAPLADVIAERSRDPIKAAIPALRHGDLSAVSTDDRARALSLYASARQQLADGDAAGAARVLERAARLDPSSAHIWRELGEAQIGSGNLAAGLASYRQALRRGISSPRVNITLGRAALLRRDFELAADHYSHALEQRGTDPATEIVAQAGLGEALLETGELAAAIEALSSALELPPRVSGATLYQGILTETFRRRADLLRRAGDAAMRLGEPALADAVYADAAAGASFDPGSILLRRVHAAMRQGRPAGAALLVVDAISDAQGRVDDRAQSLIRYLASLDLIGSALADAISEIERSLPQPVPPSVASTLARASAEAAGPHRRDAILFDHLDRFPADEAVLALLFDNAASASAAVAIAARHAETHPQFADVAAKALAATHFRLDDLLAPSGATSKTARLVRGELRLASGDPAGAWQEIETDRPNAPSSLVSVVRIAAAAGQWSVVDTALAELASAADADPALRWHLARAQRAAQRFPQALETLALVVDTSSDGDAARTGPLIDAAELSLSASQPNRADSYLRRVLAVDPRDDRAYRGLVALYGPEAPLADANQLATIVRALRQASPSSPLLRWLNAQDLARAGRLDAAERALLDLAEQDPRSPELIELLLRVWIQQSQLDEGASLERGEQWVRVKREVFPDDRTLTAAQARVLVATDRADAAATLLSDRLADRPDAQLANLLDSILRQALEDPDAADAALAEGIAGRGTGGSAGIDQTLRRAQALARLGRFDEIAPMLEEGLPAGVVHTASQRSAAGGLFAQLARGANDNPAALAAAADVFDAIEAAGIVLPPEAHALRFDVLARLPAGVARIRAAADALAALAPQQATQAYAAAAARLAQRQRAADARAMLRQAATDYRGQPAFSDLTAEWYRAEVLTGTRETVLELVGEALADDQTEAVVATFGGRPPDADATLRRAEVAYITGQILSQVNRPADAEALYRAALDLHPKHAWAANNLGYAMAERGENLDEAEALLEMAHVERPGETSITDSLGWVRYRRGVIFDEARPNGTVREGALTLLREAVALGGDSASPEIYEHLGDAAWVAGEQAEAAEAYARAGRLIDRARSLMKSSDQPDAGEMRRLENDQRRLETKAQLARAGRPPGVTRHGPVNRPTPAPEAGDATTHTPNPTPPGTGGE